MELCQVFWVVLSLFVSPGLSQTTTAPPGVPEQPPPTRTLYDYTATYQPGFPCAGSSLVQANPVIYPDSLYTTSTSTDVLLSTSYRCCTQTYVRSNATALPPTYTTYLLTVTSTSSLVCGGCEVESRDAHNVYPVDQSYTTTVTSPTTTEIAITCTSRNLKVDTATYSTCSSYNKVPEFPRDFQRACIDSLNGLSGCPWQCVLPIGTYPNFRCFNRDISGDLNFGSEFPIRYNCQQCLPPCDAVSSSSVASSPVSTTSANSTPQISTKSSTSLSTISSTTKPINTSTKTPSSASTKPASSCSTKKSSSSSTKTSTSKKLSSSTSKTSSKKSTSVKSSTKNTSSTKKPPTYEQTSTKTSTSKKSSTKTSFTKQTSTFSSTKSSSTLKSSNSSTTIKPSSTISSPTKTTSSSATCTTATDRPSEDPVWAYPIQTAAFRTTCPIYSSDISLESCPYLCDLPPSTSSFNQRFAQVPTNYKYCAVNGVSGSATTGYSYTYDPGSGSAVQKPCVKCVSPLPSASTPTPSPVVVLQPPEVLRYDCGTDRSRVPGTCPFRCAPTYYETIKGGYPQGIGRCTNDVFYNETVGGYFKHNYQTGVGDIVTNCTQCLPQCEGKVRLY